MTFKVQVSPAQVAIHQGRTVLVCETDGTIINPSEVTAHPPRWMSDVQGWLNIADWGVLRERAAAVR